MVAVEIDWFMKGSKWQHAHSKATGILFNIVIPHVVNKQVYGADTLAGLLKISTHGTCDSRGI